VSRREQPAGRAWRALLSAGALAAAFSACSSSGEGFFRRVGDMVVLSLGGTEEAPQRQLTRAELNRIPYATIAVSSGGGPRAYLVAKADNDGYLDYRDEAGNSVRLRGAPWRVCRPPAATWTRSSSTPMTRSLDRDRWRPGPARCGGSTISRSAISAPM